MVNELVDKAPARVKEKLAWWMLRARAHAAGFDRNSLQRVEEYLRVRLKLQEPRYSHPLQRPRDYFYGLTAKPWHDPPDYEWTPTLCDAHEIIRADFARVHSRFRSHPQRLTDRGQWNVYYFYNLGRKFEENCSRCPGTARVIDALPEICSAGRAYFSVLTPGTHIKPHRGATNTRLRCHLGLDVPRGCKMRVGAETRTWREGECLVFDDSFEHEVWSSADEARAVLVVDFWHPDLTAAETWAVKEIVKTSRWRGRLTDLLRTNRFDREAIL